MNDFLRSLWTILSFLSLSHCTCSVFLLRGSLLKMSRSKPIKGASNNKEATNANPIVTSKWPKNRYICKIITSLINDNIKTHKDFTHLEYVLDNWKPLATHHFSLEFSIWFFRLAILNNQMALVPNRSTQSKYFASQIHPQICGWICEAKDVSLKSTGMTRLIVTSKNTTYKVSGRFSFGQGGL